MKTMLKLVISPFENPVSKLDYKSINENSPGENK